jgi:ferredoxin-NADP reductase
LCLELVVVRLEVVADGVITIGLAPTDGGPLPPWEPGAHVDLITTTGLERQYSLCGDPADRRCWRLGVLREPDSRGGSRYIHEQLRVGDRVRTRGPRNNFPLRPAESYLFVAGGIGITPILPMLREVEGRGAPWRLVYGGRRAASMAFVEELSVYGDKVDLWPEDRHGLIDLPTLLATPTVGRDVYCCGPEPLIAAVEQLMSGWPQGALHVERFRPRPEAHADTSRAFEVELAYSGRTIAVGASQSIIDALEAAGIEVMSSCREGTCGTCETSVLEGVPDHRDAVLSAEERAANDTMMICCSRSLSPRLVLDL